MRRRGAANDVAHRELPPRHVLERNLDPGRANGEDARRRRLRYELPVRDGRRERGPEDRNNEYVPERPPPHRARRLTDS
jgi:hypothetical protein